VGYFWVLIGLLEALAFFFFFLYIHYLSIYIYIDAKYFYIVYHYLTKEMEIHLAFCSSPRLYKVSRAGLMASLPYSTRPMPYSTRPRGTQKLF
jgi:hypothetical protein